ncbi:hypothetical protein [Streptomyces sp. NPDC020983]|uniref:hypothetical protein n=1 Tax=Streptomyces sp. NPDC020983 TaxID=3365106 RepID=UPI00379AC028
MAEQAQENSPLSAAVADVANGVALALDGEGGSYALSALLAQDDRVALAAIRVLGADVLAPYALAPDPAGGAPDAQLVRDALAAYPPGADASDVSWWSYRGLAEASRAYLPAAAEVPAAGAAGGGDDAWVRTDPWPRLSHRAAQLAALSLPGLAPALAAGVAGRTGDLARGFVRAVRRRDWLQAAGVGRWLVRAPDVPATLGLDAGLIYVHRMSCGDPRVALHTTAARRFPGGGPR